MMLKMIDTISNTVNKGTVILFTCTFMSQIHHLSRYYCLDLTNPNPTPGCLQYPKPAFQNQNQHFQIFSIFKNQNLQNQHFHAGAF